MKLDKPSENLINFLEDAGFEAYVVGGCVRDALMGRPVNDYDITTNATPSAVEKVLSEKGIRFVETGLKHGTVSAIIDKKPYEITTYRTECGYTDNRHPDKVEFVTNLEEDLLRRDFTINAMAYNPKRGLVDLFGGVFDLSKKIIRTVGEPDLRFGEDALRILRALRFSSTFDFDIHIDTETSILRNAPKLVNIADERITAEFLKMIEGVRFPRLVCSFFLLFEHILGINSQKSDNHAQRIVCDLLEKAPKDVVFILASLWDFLDTEKFQKNALIGRLKLPSATVKRTLALVKTRDLCLSEDETEIRLLMAEYGKEPILDAAKLHCQKKAVDVIENIVSENKPYLISHLAVSGEDIKSLGIRGREIGETLKTLLWAVIRNQVDNEKDSLLYYIKNVL